MREITRMAPCLFKGPHIQEFPLSCIGMPTYKGIHSHAIGYPDGRVSDNVLKCPLVRIKRSVCKKMACRREGNDRDASDLSELLIPAMDLPRMKILF